MNGIDIIVLAAMAWAVFNGWRRGMILQLCTLAGVGLGLWLAAAHGAQVGRALHIGDEFATAGGFLIVLVGVMIVVALLSRLLRRIFSFAGLGALDIAAGILFSCLKMLLVLCALFSVVDALNTDCTLISRQTIEGSRFYARILSVADCIIPVLKNI
ncbi:MAG: CvpA family protein [Alistipes sp.]|nr:CvpA family protein [Alistipes sp.]MDE6779316.1 CvpA family protein [Alistipes sp.]